MVSWTLFLFWDCLGDIFRFKFYKVLNNIHFHNRSPLNLERKIDNFIAPADVACYRPDMLPDDRDFSEPNDIFIFTTQPNIVVDEYCLPSKLSLTYNALT